MLAKKLLPAIIVVVAMGALLTANFDHHEESATKMIKAANDFLNTLDKAERGQAIFKFNDKERLNWHYIPRERKGLALKSIEGAPLRAAHKLIQTGLSEVGYDQAVNVMSLEEVLFLLEGGDRELRRSKRDPLKYYISVFGNPSNRGTWGWRVEGHHLSLNYTIVDGKVVSSTPEFFGANPGTIDAGLGRQIRVLGPEEDLARQILKLCTAEQQKVAWISKKAPDDIRSRGTQQPEQTEAVGLAASKMSDAQKKLLAELLTEYLKNMPGDIEKERRAAMNKAGIDNIHFAWWGDSELHKRHEYRIQGPTFLIEYNNTQQNANHVHSIWRDMAGDFNVSAKQ